LLDPKAKTPEYGLASIHAAAVLNGSWPH